MKLKFFILGLLFAGLGLSALGQTSREEVYAYPSYAMGIYRTYPSPSGVQTPAPDGYEPFYISHYGRHGSRWLIDPEDYTETLSILEEAGRVGKLTADGEEARGYVRILAADADGRYGQLSPLGVEQHREIAERMYRAYPEVFEGEGKYIQSRSTTVPRCILSMSAFNERLKELNPSLRITRETGKRYDDYLTHYSQEAVHMWDEGTPARESYDRFAAEHVRPEKLLAKLFNDPAYAAQIDGPDFMNRMARLTGSVENAGFDFPLYELFSPDEFFDQWQTRNYEHYLRNGTAPIGEGIATHDAERLLQNILDSADEALATGDTAATLRFGHDVNLMPLAGLLEIEGASAQVTDPEKVHEVWSDSLISPMGANLQLIFFRKPGSDDVLVKILLNEEEKRIPVASDVAPYYHWKDVEEYYRSKLAE